MAETTPTASSRHLVTHEHGRAIDTHLHEPAPAPRPRDLPVPTMPIASSDMDPISRARLWRRAKVTLAVLATFFFLTLGATLLIAAGHHF